MVQIYDDEIALSRATAHLIAESAARNIAEHGSFSIVLSGGQTPKHTYDLLAGSEFINNIDWNHVKIFFGDERYVPENDERSNYKMVKEALLKHVPLHPENIFPVICDTSAEADAMRYEIILKENFPGPFPRFDLVLLGLGENGHTASLFPHTNILGETAKWVSEVWIEDQQSFRISLTAPAINAAKQIVFLVCGSNKADVLNRVLHEERNTGLLPAQLIDPAEGELIWMVDRAAAIFLNG